MVDGRFWQEQLRGLIAGRRWLMAIDVLAASAPRVALLRELGAARPFVLAGHRGLGEGPGEHEAEVVVLGSTGSSLMGQIRSAEAAFARPGEAICAQIDAWDPQCEARVLGTIFSSGESVCGRPYWGGRPPSWRALEDKLLADEIWRGAQVPYAAGEVVDAREAALVAAAARRDRGLGTVWAGDMREGFNGGAEYVRWVRQAEDCAEAVAFFGAHCDRVRVMPFLEGLPCSIHGMVFEREVIAFRPCEMVVLRAPGSSQFRYASAASFWEPRAEDAAAMREVSLRVGAHLRDRVGFRGAFTVDGILAQEGFRPTELNPRVGAALLGLAAGIPQLPLELLNLALVAGESLDWRPAELERLVLEQSRAHRTGAASMVVGAAIPEAIEVELRLGPGGSCRRVRPGDPSDVRIVAGPSPAGGFLRLVLNPDLTPVGPSVAPRVAAAVAWADREWKLDIGPVSSAPDLRPSVDPPS